MAEPQPQSQEFLCLSQLPSPALAVLGQRYIDRVEYLVFYDGLPSSECKLPYVNDARMAFVPPHAVRPTLLTSYLQRKSKQQIPLPAAIVVSGSEKLYFFHYVEGDFYAHTYEWQQVMTLTQRLRRSTPKFDSSRFEEEALAKFLIFPNVSNAAFYVQNSNYARFKFPVHRAKLCWASENLDVFNALLHYVRFGGLQQVFLYGFAYTELSQRLLQASILSSQRWEDDFQFIFLDDGAQIPPQCTALITNKFVACTCETRVILRGNLPESEILHFLLQDEHVANEREFLQKFELAYLNNAFSSYNFLQRRYKAPNERSNLKQSLLFKTRADLTQLAQTSKYLQNDENFQQFASGRAALKPFDFKVLADIITSALLRITWLNGDAVSECRARLMCDILGVLFGYNVRDVMLVVPEVCVKPTKALISGLDEAAIFVDLQSYANASTTRNTVLLLTEQQAIAYSLSSDVHAGRLPEICVIPFITCRGMEGIVEAMYANFHLQAPLFYEIVCDNSIEQYVLEYKQKCIAAYAEYDKLVQIVHTKRMTEYGSILQFLLSCGYSGDVSSNQFNYSLLGFSEPSKFLLKTDSLTISVCNFFAQNELILQASIAALYNFNDAFSIKIFAQLLQQEKDFKIEFNSSLGFQVNMLKCGYYQLQQSKNIQSFYQQSVFLDAQALGDYKEIQNLLTLNQKTPYNLLFQFLREANDYRPTDHQCQERKKQKIIYTLPSCVLPLSSNYQPVQQIYRNNPPEKLPTICEKCSFDNKNHYYGQHCDICGCLMDQIIEDSQYFRPDSRKSSWNVSQLFAKQDINAQAATNIQNSQLSVVYDDFYPDKQIILKNVLQQLSPAILDEVYKIIQTKDIKLVKAALAIVFSDRCLQNRIKINEYSHPKPIMKCILKQAISSTLQEMFNVEFCQCLVDIPLSVVLQSVCPVVLYKDYSAFIDHRISFTGNLFEQIKIFLQNEADIFQYNYAQQSNQTLGNLLSSQGLRQFCDSQLMCALQQMDLRYSFTQQLLLRKIFTSKSLCNDNMLLINIMNGLITQQNQKLWNQIAIFQANTCQLSPSLIMRAYNFAVYYLSSLTYVLKLNDEFYQKLVNSILSSNDKSGVLQLFYPGFVQMFKILDFDQIIPKLEDLQQKLLCQQQKLPEVGRIQRICIPNHHEKQKLEIVSQKPVKIIPKSQNMVSQMSFVPPQTPPQIKQTPLVQVQVPKLPLNLPSTIPIFNTTPPIVMPQQQLTSQHIPKQVMPPFIQNQLPPPQTPHPAQPNFVDASLARAEPSQVAFHVQRIINHYSCRSYYNRKNLLFVPQVKVLNPKDAFGHQLGQSLQFQPADDENDFEFLLQVLTNDFQRQTQNRYQNVHKFCTVFNEDAKQKLERVSQKPQLQLNFYDASKISVFSQWIFKRTIQAECDLSHSKIITFQQDPVLGSNLSSQRSEADKIFEMSKSDLDMAFNEALNICGQYDEAERNRQILYLVKIGIGTGSTPLETFYRFIQKGDPFKTANLLSNLVRLLTICAAKNADFPYRVQNVSSNRAEVQQSIYRLEHMRFLHIKLQQFDFLQWLDRLQRFQQLPEADIKLINTAIQQSLCCDVTQFKGWDANLGDNDRRVVQWVGSVAAEIDYFNRLLWVVDQQFSDFVTSTDSIFNMLRCFKLEKFAINDFDQSGVKRAWEIIMQIKLIFLGMFGSKRENLSIFTSEEFAYLDQLYVTIQTIWSRLHDFILCHIISDMGYTEAMMASIVGRDTRQKSKHIEFLRDGYFAQEDSFKLENSQLYQIFNAAQWQVSQFDQAVENKFFAENPLLSVCVNQQSVMQLSPQQAQNCLRELMKVDLQSLLPRQQISKELLTKRVEKIAHALRCERILSCDPMQKYLNDKAVQLTGPQAKTVNLLTCQRIESMKLPVRAVAQRGGKVSSRVIAGPPNVPPAAQNTPIREAPEVPPKQEPKKREPEKEQSQSQGNLSMQSAPQQQKMGSFTSASSKKRQQSFQTVQSQQNARRQVQIQSIAMPRGAIRIVSNTKLQFFQENADVVKTLILQVIDIAQARQQLIGQDLDSFLFYLSSCQKQTAEQWGRLYSFLINDLPREPQESQHQAQTSLQKMREFVKSQGGNTGAQEIFRYLYSYIYEQNKPESKKYDEIAQQFVESQLDIAYYNAYTMRQCIIDRKADRAKYKTNIHDAFQNMQIMSQAPLNQLIQKDGYKNKRKMALATYFFLASNPE